MEYYLYNSSKNIIANNNFINNTDNVYSYYNISTHQNTTFTNYLGNYWSDYAGSDEEGDGIGDTPYSIDSDADNYPLMEHWENYFKRKTKCFFYPDMEKRRHRSDSMHSS